MTTLECSIYFPQSGRWRKQFIFWELRQIPEKVVGRGRGRKIQKENREVGGKGGREGG